jgi:hypothetical protein
MGELDELRRKEEKENSKLVDWSRERPPWLGDLSATIPGTNLERLAYFGWIWDYTDSVKVTVARKADGASFDTAIWAVGGNAAGMEAAREALRDGLHVLWRRNLRKEGLAWLAKNACDDPAEDEANRLSMVDCITRLTNSDWWTWKAGSRLHFWRWPEVWRIEARDGAKGFHHSPRPDPRLHWPTLAAGEKWMQDLDAAKLEKLVRRGYLETGRVYHTIPRFSILKVPPGPDPELEPGDIRVVWDLKKNGVNGTMYTPGFAMPTLGTYLRRIETGTFAGDFDVGEQFHIYQLHESERAWHGAEIPRELVNRLRAESIEVDHIMRWCRLPFGWQASPYQALRMLARLFEMGKGRPEDASSAFSWHRTKLNLPGMDDYDPSRPCVMKLRLDGRLAADIIAFYDDGRVFGPDAALARQALRQIVSRMQWYGNQDAARKRRDVDLRPGVWAGNLAFADQGLLRKTTPKTKWDKAKNFLAWLAEGPADPRGFPLTLFRSGAGFLVNTSIVYNFIKPYLKGLFLTLEGHRSGRDKDGWRATSSRAVDADDEALDEFISQFEGTDLEVETAWLLSKPVVDTTAYPAFVKPVPRLATDVAAMQRLLVGDSPVQVIVRPVRGPLWVAYGGGDASGEGLGSQIVPKGFEPLVRKGFWCKEESERSSNYREGNNLRLAVEKEVELGRLTGRELWLATDNMTCETTFYRGSSTSRDLHELMLDLRLLTVRGNFILHVVHIAGTRMIEIGVDGLSRGETHLGALDFSFGDALPLHLSPLERSPSLGPWLSSWLDVGYQIATPSQWFYEAQQAGEYTLPEVSKTWVWSLPPAAALHVLEELSMGRLKRHNLLRGVVLVPGLMRPEWFRRFVRTVDVYFVIPAGACPEWPASMHEPLTVGIYLPLFSASPWDWRRVPFLVPFAREMSSMYKAGDPSGRDFLREFWASSGELSEMPGSMVSRVLQGNSWRRFLGISSTRRKG